MWCRGVVVVLGGSVAGVLTWRGDMGVCRLDLVGAGVFESLQLECFLNADIWRFAALTEAFPGNLQPSASQPGYLEVCRLSLVDAAASMGFRGGWCGHAVAVSAGVFEGCRPGLILFSCRVTTPRDDESVRLAAAHKFRPSGRRREHTITIGERGPLFTSSFRCC